MAWLYDHQYEVIGQFGHWDTPVHRYIEQTRDNWKKGSFPVGNAYENKPRWMDRLDNYCAERLRDPDVKGCDMIGVMWRIKEWDIPYYDHSHYWQRLNA